ncbi:hypothetical protein ACFWXH_22765 [Mesorhizobium sp. NPDC059054]|uniref:hypothetical protein n=1 Tax=Mesorhizobium sp. NPDC059054 TaxID=3346711 RepID=UPI003698A766
MVSAKKAFWRMFKYDYGYDVYVREKIFDARGKDIANLLLAMDDEEKIIWIQYARGESEVSRMLTIENLKRLRKSCDIIIQKYEEGVVQPSQDAGS